MDKQILEWRNENSYRDYPLEHNDKIEKDIILDACFYLNSPVYLTRIEPQVKGYKITINENITFYYTSGKYAFNDFGKICLGSIDKIKTTTEFENLKFLDSVCYGNFYFSIMGLQGDVVLDGDIEVTENDIGISVKEQPTISHQCIKSINGIETDHFVLGRDACTEINMYPNGAVIHDICKPPCYNCNERLTTGDVSQVMTGLENRVAELEEHHQHGGYKYDTVVITTTPTSSTEITIKKFVAGTLIKKITLLSDFIHDGTIFVGTSDNPTLILNEDYITSIHDIYYVCESEITLKVFLSHPKNGKIIVETLGKVV